MIFFTFDSIQQMKRYKNKSTDENRAISNLTAISELDTCYIRDWEAIKEEIVEESSSELKKTVIPKNDKKSVSCKKISKMSLGTMSSRKLSKVFKNQHSISKDSIEVQQTYQNNKREEDVQKEEILKAKEDNQRKTKTVMKVPTVMAIDQQSDLGSLKVPKFSNFYKGDLKHVKMRKVQEIKKDIDNSINRSEFDKLRKMSLPWLKCIPHISPEKIEKEKLKKQKIQEEREQIRKLNEIARNKIKLRRNNKYIFNKESQHKSINMEQTVNHESIASSEPSQGEINLLKNWIERRHSKNKRSVTSLLREHFQQKCQEKKIIREKLLLIRKSQQG